MRSLYRYNKETGTMELIAGTDNTQEVHNIITDEIEPTMSMTGTDKIYTSKSALRREYKELGFIETGNARIRPNGPAKPDRQAIRDAAEKAYYDIKYDRIPISEAERETCRREERAYKDWKRRNGHM